MYDLVRVEPGPLPPHERTWRHPSELGPTAADVEQEGSHRTAIAALATGAVALVVVGALVVAAVPRPPTSPIALSATTSPGRPAPAAESDIAAGAETAPTPSPSNGVTAQPIGLASFSAIPNAVAASPEVTLDGASVAPAPPGAGDSVYLHTDAVTYRADWHDVEQLVSSLAVPDGSVVFDEGGDVVAHVRRGELITLVED